MVIMKEREAIISDRGRMPSDERIYVVIHIVGEFDNRL
jgi:hypothetical protein